MFSDNQLREMYEKVGNDYLLWEDKADDLIAAAKVITEQRKKGLAYIEKPDIKKLSQEEEEFIEQSSRLRLPELMLRGYAIECLLKSLWIKAGNSIVVEGKNKGVSGAGEHNLIQLAQEVDIPLDEKYKDMLKRLQNCTTFAGRYPIPKSWKTVRNELGIGWSSPTDYNTYNNLVKIIKDKLHHDDSK